MLDIVDVRQSSQNDICPVNKEQNHKSKQRLQKCIHCSCVEIYDGYHQTSKIYLFTFPNYYFKSTLSTGHTYNKYQPLKPDQLFLLYLKNMTWLKVAEHYIRVSSIHFIAQANQLHSIFSKRSIFNSHFLPKTTRLHDGKAKNLKTHYQLPQI